MDDLKRAAFSTCISDDEYNQYDCFHKYSEDRLRAELSCILPHHAHNNLNTSKRVCEGLEDFAESDNQVAQIYEAAMTPSSGCLPSCETWSYDTVLDDYSYDRMFSKLNPHWRSLGNRIPFYLRCKVKHFDALDRQFRPAVVQRPDRAAPHHSVHRVQGL